MHAGLEGECIVKLYGVILVNVPLGPFSCIHPLSLKLNVGKEELSFEKVGLRDILDK